MATKMFSVRDISSTDCDEESVTLCVTSTTRTQVMRDIMTPTQRVISVHYRCVNFRRFEMFTRVLSGQELLFTLVSNNTSLRSGIPVWPKKKKKTLRMCRRKIISSSAIA